MEITSYFSMTMTPSTQLILWKIIRGMSKLKCSLGQRKAQTSTPLKAELDGRLDKRSCQSCLNVWNRGGRVLTMSTFVNLLTACLGAAERLPKDADILLPIKCCVLRSEIQLYVSTVVQSFLFTKYKKYKIWHVLTLFIFVWGKGALFCNPPPPPVCQRIGI